MGKFSTSVLIGLFMCGAFAWAGGNQEQSGAASTGGDPKLSGKMEVTLPAGDYVDYMKTRVVPYFQKEYPNVQVIVSPEGGTDKLQARIAAGDPPNLYAGVFGYQPVQFARAQNIIPLEKMPGATELLSRIDSRFVDRSLGHVYYIPWNATTTLMIYNKDLFKQAGLNPDSPPATTAEFLADAKAISALPKQKDGTPVYGTVFWNEALNWGGWYWSTLAPIYYSFNHGKYQLFNKLGTDVVFDNPDAHFSDFLSFLREAQQYAPKTMDKGFFNRNVGMWLQFGFGWKTNLKQAKDHPMEIGKDVGIAPIPVQKAGDTPWSTLDGRALMIFRSNPDQQNLDWAFVRYLMQNQANLQSDIALGQLPTLTSLESDPFFTLPQNKPFVDQLQYTLINEPVAELSDVTVAIQKVIAEVAIDRSMTPEQGVREAASNARAILKKSSQ